MPKVGAKLLLCNIRSRAPQHPHGMTAVVSEPRITTCLTMLPAGSQPTRLHTLPPGAWASTHADDSESSQLRGIMCEDAASAEWLPAAQCGQVGLGFRVARCRP